MRQGCRPASRETLERLRRRHLVQQVPIDVEQARSVLTLGDDVRVPDFVVERSTGGHEILGKAREW